MRHDSEGNGYDCLGDVTYMTIHDLTEFAHNTNEQQQKKTQQRVDVAKEKRSQLWL